MCCFRILGFLAVWSVHRKLHTLNSTGLAEFELAVPMFETLKILRTDKKAYTKLAFVCKVWSCVQMLSNEVSRPFDYYLHLSYTQSNYILCEWIQTHKLYLIYIYMCTVYLLMTNETLYCYFTGFHMFFWHPDSDVRWFWVLWPQFEKGVGENCVSISFPEVSGAWNIITNCDMKKVQLMPQHVCSRDVDSGEVLLNFGGGLWSNNAIRNEAVYSRIVRPLTNWKGPGRKWSWTQQGANPLFVWGNRENHKNVGHNSLWSLRGSNRAPHEYKCRALPRDQFVRF
jgi:hypothetical protein